ncbi:competence type IV pilus minor pilin ComGF [Staphylococcus americanisciuri]|uniref:Uncharacterized protein n=1 Tax=Staphylococcus americanisciuri TaxID=2973940 RepID=A0ABT2EZ81_9STAP|nr:competence type IV pilus minor pilin ComGF [Staphylococcus americanisciuri]MCS4485521.1 hypothetical protein [Staphylococcus americanisciuri]
MAKEIGSTLHDSRVRNVNVTNHYLEIRQNNAVYTYRLRNLKLIKQVNYKGNITVLNQVRNVNFTKVGRKNIKIDILVKVGDKWIEKSFIV